MREPTPTAGNAGALSAGGAPVATPQGQASQGSQGAKTTGYPAQRPQWAADLIRGAVEGCEERASRTGWGSSWQIFLLGKTDLRRWQPSLRRTAKLATHE